MGHTEDFVHAWGDGVDRGSASNFVFKFGAELFTTSDNFFTFFTIWVPSVFLFCAGFLAECAKSNLGEAVFNDFVAILEFVFFPIAQFAGGLLQSSGDFLYLFVCERVVVDLAPMTGVVRGFVFGDFYPDRAEFFVGLRIGVILGALGNKEV